MQSSHVLPPPFATPFQHKKPKTFICPKEEAGPFLFQRKPLIGSFLCSTIAFKHTGTLGSHPAFQRLLSQNLCKIPLWGIHILFDKNFIPNIQNFVRVDIKIIHHYMNLTISQYEFATTGLTGSLITKNVLLCFNAKCSSVNCCVCQQTVG